MKNPVTINLVDGGLGIGSDGADGLHLKIGVAEAGDANKIVSITNDKEPEMFFSKGQLVDSLVRHFNEGGIRCFALRPENDVAGTIGSVTHQGTGTTTMSTGGTPEATNEFLVEIIEGGAHETATFRYSKDGGITFSDVYTTPAQDADVSLGNGITVVFGNGVFVAGDTYSFTVTGPTASVTNFLAAIDSARGQFDPDNYPYMFIHIVGGFARVFWESVADKIEDFEDSRIFIHFILEYPEKETGVDEDSYFQTLINEGRLFSDKRIAVVGSRQRYGDDNDFRSTAILLCANLSRARVNHHPGWVGEFKSITGSEIEHWDVLKDYTESLDTSNIIYACVYDNWPGIYIKKDHLMSPADSDFQTIHDLRPADKVRFLAYNTIMPFLNGESEGDEYGIEALIAELDNEISSNMEISGEEEIVGHEIDIDPDQDLTTGELTGAIHLYKTHTMEKITIDVGYRKAE